MKSQQKVFKLQMRYPFGISRGTTSVASTVLYNLGGKGQGEATPVRYKNHNEEDFLPALAKLSEGVDDSNIDDIEYHDERARKEYSHLSSVLTAFNLALWDARGRKEGKPVYQLVGEGKKPTILSTYTISLSDNDTMVERTREAAHMPLLKVKLGRDEEQDYDVMKRIRDAAPNASLKIDANAGWSVETALSIIPKLQDLGVELIEQPLKIGNYEGMKKLISNLDIPIVADEDAQDLASLEKLKGCVTGINIKLMKCGGISEALKMIKVARQEGWCILIGCMLETRLGLGAASHLADMVDYMDVDAHMLSTNDPFPPGSLKEFAPDLPLADGPGLGLPHLDLENL